MSETRYIRTETILDEILAHKVIETEACKAQRPLPALHAMMAQQQPPRDFAGALRRETVALIAEVKKASPSKGVLIEDFDPVRLARTYADNGAAAISVLTDERFFQGHMRYLEQIRTAVPTPLLCKEFIIDEYLVYEARAFGADAILLIVAALEDSRLADLHALAHELGMAVLVEAHDEAEVERALHLNPQIIGINNRDLKTFHVDVNTTARLAALIPDDVVLVAESGIASADDVAQMGRLGAHAVLVGESLVRSADVGVAVRAYASQRR